VGTLSDFQAQGGGEEAESLDSETHFVGSLGPDFGQERPGESLRWQQPGVRRVCTREEPNPAQNGACPSCE